MNADQYRIAGEIARATDVYLAAGEETEGVQILKNIIDIYTTTAIIETIKLMEEEDQNSLQEMYLLIVANAL